MKKIVRSYKMTSDNGTAPNPFHNVLTLAICKPGIRRCVDKKEDVEEWVAGFTSKKLGYVVGEERLVYLMKISNKLPFADYYEKYPEKRPNDINPEGMCGDNFYKDGKYPPAIKHYTGHVTKEDWEKDLKVKKGSKVKKDVLGVLLAENEFYYFGKEALEIPADVRPNIPKKQVYYGMLTENDVADKFINYVREKAGAKGRLGDPHTWPDNRPQNSCVPCCKGKKSHRTC